MDPFKRTLFIPKPISQEDEEPENLELRAPEPEAKKLKSLKLGFRV